MKRVAIVGGGAAGLVATRWFAQSSKWDVHTFEKNNEIGGAWVYREDDGVSNSSMYKMLRSNLPKETMAYPDFPFSEELPTFITHSDVLSYLNSYCEKYCLDKHIHFNSMVEKISPVSKNHPIVGPWNIKWKENDLDCYQEEFDNVIICNGHYSTPYTPNIHGIEYFKGNTSHSHCYRTKDGFKDKRVALLGNGASAVDIGLEIATVADALYHCKRKSSDSMFGNPDDGVIACDAISRINEDGDIVLEDSTILTNIDHLLFCTGYHYDYPFLDEKSSIEMKYKRIEGLYQHILPFNSSHPQYYTCENNVIPPTIAFIGLLWKSIQFPLYDIQTRYILDLWEGNTELPTSMEMRKSIENWYNTITNSLPKHYLHSLGPLQWEYCEELNIKSGKKKEITEFLNYIRPIYDMATEIRKEYPNEYKHMNILTTGNECKVVKRNN